MANFRNIARTEAGRPRPREPCFDVDIWSVTEARPRREIVQVLGLRLYSAH
jgi:hypothetical protein